MIRYGYLVTYLPLIVAALILVLVAAACWICMIMGWHAGYREGYSAGYLMGNPEGWADIQAARRARNRGHV